MKTALETKRIAKGFGGVAAVDGVSMTFEAAKITSVIGPNGSGKSTLMNLLTGMLPFDEGSVLLGGTELRRIAPHDCPAYGITRTFQEVRLFEQMSVLDNLLVVLTERNVWGALFERHTALHLKKAEDVLRTVGLWEKRAAPAADLSYGQRKLLEIGRTLAMSAGIVLFDEPFAGLFPEMVKKVAELLKEMRSQGTTVILIEHTMPLIRELSDHVVVMDAGKVLAQGSPAEVLARRDVIEAYLGE